MGVDGGSLFDYQKLMFLYFLFAKNGTSTPNVNEKQALSPFIVILDASSELCLDLLA